MSNYIIQLFYKRKIQSLLYYVLTQTTSKIRLYENILVEFLN